MKQKLSVLSASAFGSGFIPFAPGTWGTAVGVGIIAVFWMLGGQADWIFFSIGIALIGLGYLSIINLPSNWVHDDQRIVIDEVIGVWFTMAFIPFSWINLLLAFMLFRIFDIWKPLGIRSFDQRSSEMSVILDDVLAGIYANLVLHLVIYLIP